MSSEDDSDSYSSDDSMIQVEPKRVKKVFKITNKELNNTVSSYLANNASEIRQQQKGLDGSFDHLFLGVLVRYIKYSLDFKEVKLFWNFIEEQFEHVSHLKYKEDKSSFKTSSSEFLMVRFLQYYLQNAELGPEVWKKLEILEAKMNQLNLDQEYLLQATLECVKTTNNKRLDTFEQLCSDMHNVMVEYKQRISDIELKTGNINNTKLLSTQIEQFLKISEKFEKDKDAKMNSEASNLLNQLGKIEDFSQRSYKIGRDDVPDIASIIDFEMLDFEFRNNES